MRPAASQESGNGSGSTGSAPSSSVGLGTGSTPEATGCGLVDADGSTAAASPLRAPHPVAATSAITAVPAVIRWEVEAVDSRGMLTVSVLGGWRPVIGQGRRP
ncbi:hypothetical protein GCM10027294_18250 [Marinactinospora endophytica]